MSIWERYTLTIEEASNYFRIGEKKLRKIAEESKKMTVCQLYEKHTSQKRNVKRGAENDKTYQKICDEIERA